MNALPNKIDRLKFYVKLFEALKDNIWQIINHKFGIYLIQKVIERNIDRSLEFYKRAKRKRLSKEVKLKFGQSEAIAELSKESSNFVSSEQNNSINNAKQIDNEEQEKGVREWIEDMCINQFDDMIDKRYSKYVLFRVTVGAVYSEDSPENKNDSSEEN